MKKVLMTILLSTTVITGAQAQDYGVRESTAWFGELVNKWETTTNRASNRQELTDGSFNAQGIDGTGHRPSWGWCNEAVVWAMDQVDMFDNAEDEHEGFAQMRGRHWTTDYNDKVTQSFNHDQEFNWSDVPIGTVALMDFQSNPTESGNLGIDHVSTFMGKVNDEWGWFLGGNQNGKLQPKLYRLDQMTHGSIFSEQGADVTKHYYDNVEEMARIKIEDGSWTKSTVSGWGWGRNEKAKYTNGGPATSWWMSKQWNQLGSNNIQKFQSGNNVVYVESIDSMEVYEGQIVRSIDYYDHVEINDMKNHIGTEVMMSRKIQKDHSWWDSRTNANSQSFRDSHDTGNQWHDRVYTAKAINEALDTQWDRTFNSVFSNSHRDINGASTEFVALFNGDANAKAEHYDYTLARELYMEYNVEYYDDDETLMSDLYNTQGN